MLIAVLKTIQSTKVTELDSDCEIIWVKLITQDKKHLYVCSYYRPHVSDEANLHQFEQSINRADNGKARIVVGGDLNFPDWVWSTKRLKRLCQYPTLHNKLTSIIIDHSMEQIVDSPTREDKFLDLVITDTPNIIPKSGNTPWNL